MELWNGVSDFDWEIPAGNGIRRSNAQYVSLESHTPTTCASGRAVPPADLRNVRWVSH